MAIMSKTVKAAKKNLADLKKQFNRGVTQVRSTFTFAAKEDLRALVAKVDQLEAKLNDLLEGKKSRA